MAASASRQRKKGKAWSGRFAEPVDALVQRFTASVSFDKRLALHDIAGSLAHARMLAACGVIGRPDLKAIEARLARVRAEIRAGKFTWSLENEDVHGNIERRLIELAGDAGKRLHTARSRNDQVATDVRLWLRDEIDAIAGHLDALEQALLAQASRHAALVMPGFTHLQVAQPVTFGHHLLAYAAMFERDRARLADCRRRVNVLPLGAAALAGTTFPIDRARVARELGFESIAANSLDAVSDRDFAIEFAACAALVMVHLSRFAEELILWMSPRYGFVRIPDRFCTGSSIMPQKKNPDVPELVRGKSGRVFGHLMALLALMKGQPLAYNKDNQEDKEPLFDTVDTVKDSLRAFAALVAGLAAAGEGDARRGAGRPRHRHRPRRLPGAQGLAVPRRARGRRARGARGGQCRLRPRRRCRSRRCSASRTKIGKDVYKSLTLEGSVAARNHLGGTAPAQVRAAIARARSLPARAKARKR